MILPPGELHVKTGFAVRSEPFLPGYRNSARWQVLPRGARPEGSGHKKTCRISPTGRTSVAFQTRSAEFFFEDFLKLFSEKVLEPGFQGLRLGIRQSVRVKPNLDVVGT